MCFFFYEFVWLFSDCKHAVRAQARFKIYVYMYTTIRIKVKWLIFRIISPFHHNTNDWTISVKYSRIQTQSHTHSLSQYDCNWVSLVLFFVGVPCTYTHDSIFYFPIILFVIFVFTFLFFCTSEVQTMSILYKRDAW